MTKICLFEAGGGRSFDLGNELERLREALNELQDCRLIIVDPITAYLGQFSENSGTQGRRLIYPLSELAEAWGVAIVLVTHLRRGNGKAIHRPTGSDALVRAARAVWLVRND